MKRFNVFVCAVSLCSLLLLTSCQLDENVLLENPTGYIVTGETGNRFVVEDYSISPIAISGAVGQTHDWSYLLDSVADARIVVAATNSSSPGSYDYNTTVDGIGSVQIAGHWVHDSLWRCENWPIDSSTAEIVQYNNLSSYNCTAPSREFAGMDAVYDPYPYPLAQRIDATSPWGASSGIFSRTTSHLEVEIHPNGAYIYTTFRSEYRFWNYNDLQYVGFRWWSHDHFRYGYVKLRAGYSEASILAIVYER